ncbi:MAG TPA: hypothetical protein VK689_03810, partial [Armatimonadota bacterium]|nr:hypothetical protein [Armatimonadota bacterium]
FQAGSVAERPFLVEERGSETGKGFRFADRDGSFVYRFNRLGPDATLELELGNQFQVGVTSGADPGLSLQPVAPGLAAVRVASAYPVVQYPLTGAEPLLQQRAGGATPAGDASPAWVSRAGSGFVVYCGAPAAFGADSVAGADLVRGLVRLACGRVGLEYAEGSLLARRGPYVVANALGRKVELKGSYLNLFDPDFPLIENPQLPYREPVVYKQVPMTSRIPVLLHATHRARVTESSVAQTRLLLDGPKETWGTLRIFPAGMSLAGITAVETSGAVVNVDARIEGRTVRIRYPQSPTGVNLTVRWVRPEARISK